MFIHSALEYQQFGDCFALAQEKKTRLRSSLSKIFLVRFETGF